jgi:PncC family amidohydrolase
MAHQAGREAEDHLLSSTAAADLTRLAARIQAIAIERGLTVATAESCTGGLVGHCITENPGSSGFYLGGVVSYADEVKVQQLGVSADLLERRGAVSADVAAALAVGVRERLGSDLGVSVTGVAGPGGGTKTKPVGLTYVAAASRHGCDVRRHEWQGDRAANKRSSGAAALLLLLETLEATQDRGS